MLEAEEVGAHEISQESLKQWCFPEKQSKGWAGEEMMQG